MKDTYEIHGYPCHPAGGQRSTGWTAATSVGSRMWGRSTPQNNQVFAPRVTCTTCFFGTEIGDLEQ